MPTYGEKCLSDFESALKSLDDLAKEPYEPSDVRDVLSTLGAQTELFLKSVVFPAKNPRNTLEWFIDELGTVGVPQSLRDNLHELRRKYNTAKHDPTSVIPIVTANQIVRDARDSISHVVSNHLGSVDAVSSPHLHRVYWIAAWDHYVHGDTEVHVILPIDSEHWLGPPTLDIVYINGLAWGSVKDDLDALGDVHDGRGIIPDIQYDRFNADSDFAGALVFEGDYRDLITTLASKELRQDLIPGLNRHEDSSAMINAFLLAAVDIASACGPDESLVDDIKQQAIRVYAVPNEFRHAEHLAEGMAEMIRNVATAERGNLTGPSWVGKDRFDVLQQNAISRHGKYDIIVDDEHVIRMLWG